MAKFLCSRRMWGWRGGKKRGRKRRKSNRLSRKPGAGETLRDAFRCIGTRRLVDPDWCVACTAGLVGLQRLMGIAPPDWDWGLPMRRRRQRGGQDAPQYSLNVQLSRGGGPRRAVIWTGHDHSFENTRQKTWLAGPLWVINRRLLPSDVWIMFSSSLKCQPCARAPSGPHGTA